MKKNYFKKCLRFLKGCKKEFILVIILGLIVASVSVITPSLSGKIITEIMNGEINDVIKLVVISFLVVIISIFCSFLITKLYLKVRKIMVFNIRKELSRTVLDFEMSNFNNNNSGSFINKVKDDPKEITDIFNKIKDNVINGVANVGALIYVFYLSWQIGLLYLLFMYVIYEVKMIGIRKKIEAKDAYLKEEEKYASLLGEMLRGMQDIKALNLKENYLSKTDESFKTAGDLEYKGDFYQNVYDKIAKLLEIVSLGLVVLLGLFLIKHNLLTGASLIIIFLYKSNIYSLLDRLTMFMNLLAHFNLSCTRIFSILDNDNFSKEKYGNKKLDKSAGVIEFKNVSFKYKSNYILKDCSFKIGPYETVALVGKSGCGKTTILNLISKIYNIDKGNILLDGMDISDIDESYLRNNISVISQNPYLFDLSIKDNFRLIKDDISDAEIKMICKKVCLHDYIKNLPDKYDTIIGEGGTELSVGQKQRLGIARALLRGTPIILLDEITSALDNETGRVIKEVIESIKDKHTIIIVTHELSMIKDCNRILIMDDGQIVDDGNHNKLLKSSIIYKNLYKIK